MSDRHRRNANIFKAVCDEKRLNILALLQDGEKCACELMEETGIAQSALSYHMRILCESGLVKGRQDGKWIHYQIDQEGSKQAIQILQDITKVK